MIPAGPIRNVLEVDSFEGDKIPVERTYLSLAGDQVDIVRKW